MRIGLQRSRRHWPAAILVSAGCLISCGDSPRANHAAQSEPELRSGAESVCRTKPGSVSLYLQLPADGGFRLNNVPLDSSGLAGWISTGLARWKSTPRFVLILADSGRQADLRWVIPSIEGAGAGAYRADSASAAACLSVAGRAGHSVRLLSNVALKLTGLHYCIAAASPPHYEKAPQLSVGVRQPCGWSWR